MQNSLGHRHGQFTSKQLRVTQVLEKRGTSVAYMTEQEVADEAKVSIATVSRCWALLGYMNFKDYKKAMKKKLEVTPENKLKNAVEEVQQQDLLTNMVQKQMNHLAETNQHVSREDFNQAVLLISRADPLFIFAPGPSESLGCLAQFRLSRLGVPVAVMPKSGHELFESMIHLSSSSVLLIFQFVQTLPETDVLVDYAKEVGCRVVLVTDRLYSDLHRQTESTLFARRGELWEFHSMVPPMMIIESLIVGIAMLIGEPAMEKLELLSKVRKNYKAKIPK
ncbi:MurR/RpiR family transcriptional regulator [Jeotgalibacillus proteolyticus]|uniref:MurR/RpiR family transcriptional regulator n=1 Tax=Jeotgalibacillus proteolyticus TaxID=2082395 RepID=UPI003CEC8E4E